MELIGRRFGHIRVTEVVGQGGMGDVYAGYDEKLERKVALKVLNSDQRLDDEARERLLREARALSKLEHPNICRIHDYIETGDVDLLVLEYIDGRTLHDALYADKMPRSEKLRIAAAIAEVMVKAHRAGIVHRDLKPENVMLTKSGEVKVLDFGLARWLNRAKRQSSDRLSALRVAVKGAAEGPSAPAETLILPPPLPGGTDRFHSDGVRREFLATAVGITLGTPIFMSPEQARGEPLTPASDMFSFGLLLQTLFTGQDPHPMGLTAREVILRVARGETLPVHGLPGDVTALINRLKQFAPADRPTALEALERLRTMEEKPQRIARRAIVGALALIALLGAWRYTVDLKAERALAVAARAEADQRRGQAENLIEFMLGDLRKKLEPVGRLDILDEVGERTMAYVSSLDPKTMSADELSRSSKALNQLGEVRMIQGKPVEALLTFQRSLAVAQAATERDRSSANAQLALATANFWVGDVYRQQSRLSEALRHYTAYMTTAETLAKRYPQNEEYQLERAYGHSVVAAIYERQGELARALEHLRLTRDVKSALLAAKPNDADREADVANTLNRIGFVLEQSADLRGARQHYDMEHTIYSRLVRRDPRNTRWKERLATSHSYLGSLLEAMGEVDGALVHRKADLALTRELTGRDAANVTWRRNLAIALMRYGNALRLTGQNSEALRAVNEAERTLAPLLAQPDALTSWRRDLAVVRTASARIHLASGNAARAEPAVTAAIAALEALTGSDKALPRYLADSYLVLGQVHAAGGDRAAAMEAWQKAVTHIAPLRRESRTPGVLDTYARALHYLGRSGEAAPVIAQLTKIEYRAPDFVSATTEQ